MITTTVTWPQTPNTQNPTTEEIYSLSAMANQLSPDVPSELTSALSSDGTAVIANRTWPTQEIAQAWVDYVLANYNVTSAVVNS